MSRETALAALQSLSDEEADLLNSDPVLLGRFKQKHQLEQLKPSLMNQAWNVLAVPEQKSREGLQMIARGIGSQYAPEVTGNLPRDIAMNVGRIGTETLAETAPGFVSRGAILTAGALKGLKVAKPAIKAAGRGIARAAESISGLEYKTPGILQEAASGSGVLFAPGRKAAGPLYEAGKEGSQVRPILSKIPGKKEFVEKAYDLAQKGKLKALEALEARKELASMKKSVTGEFFRKATEKFNEIAKPAFQVADEAFSKGLRADELKRFLPVNKMGGTSIAKSTLGTIAGALPMAAMSPIVQGTVATGVGAASRAASPLINNPVTTAGIIQALKLTKEKAKEFLKKAKGNKEKAVQMALDAGYDPYQ